MAELSKKFEVHPVIIAKWKSEFLERMSIFFKAPDEKESEDILDTRNFMFNSKAFMRANKNKFAHHKLDYYSSRMNILKKHKEVVDQHVRMKMVNPNDPNLSIRRQCSLMSIPRSSLYYQPKPEKPENLRYMEIMDVHLTEHPDEGVVYVI